MTTIVRAGVESSRAPKPRAGLLSLRSYQPPRADARIDLRLDGNEGPSPDWLARRLAQIDAELLRRYPDASAFERLIADKFHIAPEQVLVTAGADEAIDRVCRAFVERGDELILPAPSFEMIRHYAMLAGANVIEPRWLSGPYPVAAVLDAVTPRTRVMAVVSPNNPTGAVASADDLRQLSNSAPPETLLMVDLAYVEFADADLTQAVMALSNAVAVRSYSKAWGLAGLRVGYAMGPVATIAALRTAGGPYSVAGPSLWLAARAMEQSDAPPQPYLDSVRRERVTLRSLLIELGVQAWPSQANFVLARFGNIAPVAEGLAEYGIAARRFNPNGKIGSCLRITCPGDAEMFDRLTSALREVLSGEGNRK